MSDSINRGPVAPKDPTKKRPFFYIMKDKEIFGAPQPDGSFAHFLYMDMGRLIDAAKLTGNVTDEDMVECMKSRAGLQKMVHSIGVSVSSADADKSVKFVVEMYPVTPGDEVTNIEALVPMDDMEMVIDLSKVDWKDGDRELGQIRYVFDAEGIQGTTTVKFYLNDGFEAPEQPAEEPVDFEGAAYKAMIQKSLMQTGNESRIKKVLEKAKNGQDVTLGFIGGSITQGAGAIPINEKCYARVFYEDFAKRYMKGGECIFVKAGVGGTPSELGMIRFERDVLRDGAAKPDLIVIEFAVNDEGDETQGVCYESLVRKALALPWKPAVVLLFAVFSNDWNLQDRLSPVGRNYCLPMVSVLDAVSPQFPLLPGKGRVISKNQFFYDVYHPSNLGHQIMADCLSNLIDTVSEDAVEVAEEKALEEIAPVIGADFEHIELLDRKELPALKDKFNIVEVTEGSFDQKDTDLQAVEMDKDIEMIPEFPHNWCHEESTDGTRPFKMTLTCKRLLLIFKDSASATHGTAEVFVDGKFIRDADPHVNGWTHCNAVVLINEAEAKPREVLIQMKEGHQNKKFTILGFGVE
ncbi:SGNH/GDSL hydrolase family protein [Butyrivibrio sp. CB08]|uniref:SGNH/GDSL hydrolase family protein n=1 Tax=Butyrivibrio sp. CB08 TaxID=2364879 RepID=UPI000EA9177A|nr:SGNH/GDSL hydrolase family protein [Butyrivibrio sp. CB08]RKM59946.1 SGNH/GDSL hydrolase family protein [Butyrivibrio sp. CB08]